jgi:hypothetical protein
LQALDYEHVGREREILIAELREIEPMDADYYRQGGPGDVTAYTLRQQRRRLILLELANRDLRGHLRLSIDMDITLFCLGHGMIKGRISDLSESGFAAELLLRLPFGETVTAEIHLPFGIKTAEAVVRNRNAFRHGFEFVGTDLSEEMHWLQ